jgi:pyridoxal phosphate enzyme (YggS family)
VIPAGEGAGDRAMNASASRIEAYRAAHAVVLERIADACERVGRDPADVTLVAVSKTVPAEALREAVAAGLDLLGENRVQEGAAKAAEVPGARWHLVGPLQSNKARRALETFDSIQTVDSLDLARRLDRLVPEIRPKGRYPVLVEVNVDQDPAKAGFRPADTDEAMGELLALPHLEVRGLMTVGRLAGSPAEARRTFKGLRELSDWMRGRWPGLGPELSMGMTDDFEVAVEEGATIVRVGRAIFGERPHDHDDGGADHGPDHHDLTR